MWITLLISFCLVIHVHADLFTKTNTTAKAKKLSKLIEDACPKNTEIYHLMKDLQSYGMNGRGRLRYLFFPAQARILSDELRGIMKIGSVGYWTNYTKPNDQEMEKASTIDQYYLLKERKNLSLSYNQTELLKEQERLSLFYDRTELFSEIDMKFVVKALDKRFPRIRSTFKKYLNEIRQRQDAPIIIDRKEVDMMFKKVEYITYKFSLDFDRIHEKEHACSELKFNARDQYSEEMKDILFFTP